MRLVITDARLARWLTSNPVPQPPLRDVAAAYRWLAHCITVEIPGALLALPWPIVEGAHQR